MCSIGPDEEINDAVSIIEKAGGKHFAVARRNALANIVGPYGVRLILPEESSSLGFVGADQDVAVRQAGIRVVAIIAAKPNGKHSAVGCGDRSCRVEGSTVQLILPQESPGVEVVCANDEVTIVWSAYGTDRR